MLFDVKSYVVKTCVQEGTFGYICPKCGKLTYTRLKIKSVKNPDEIKNVDCECGNHIDRTYIIDGNIAHAVHQLQLHGYMTQYSCEGHALTKRQYDSSYEASVIPYIAFEEDVYKSIVVDLVENHPLPAPWRLDDEYCAIIYDRYKELEDQANFMNDSFKEPAIKLINEWVDTIPAEIK